MVEGANTWRRHRVDRIGPGTTGAYHGTERITSFSSCRSSWPLGTSNPSLPDRHALRRLCSAANSFAGPRLARREHPPGPPVVNLYGPTETTIDATSCALRTEHLVAPIGRPIDGISAFVSEEGLYRLTPLDTDGDLYLGGVGLARGYVGRPGWTAASFLPDALSGDAGARLYMTGDRARWVKAAADTPELDLEFRGRADDQVKLHGQRVELGEIDAVLSRHPGVHEAATLLVDQELGKRLVAHLATAMEGRLDAELREYLADRLPRAMIPNAFVFHPALPRTASGKIDRRALTAMAVGVSGSRRPYAAPRSKIERVLAAIFADVLGVERVGIDDDFYELGGDLIIALQIISRLRQAGWRLSPRSILQHPTVARATAFAAPLSASPNAMAPARPTAGIVPLAPIQRDFFSRLDAMAEAGFSPGSVAHWNQSILLTVSREIEPAAIQRAVLAVARVHAASHLRFRRTADGWEQRYVPEDTPGGIAFETVDLSTAKDWTSELTSRAEQAQATLDLDAGPVGRAIYFVRGAERGRLLLVLHHLVVDVVSWQILLDDLSAALAQAIADAKIELPLPSSSYADWVAALEARAHAADAGPWLALSEKQLLSPGLDRLFGASEEGLGRARTRRESRARRKNGARATR